MIICWTQTKVSTCIRLYRSNKPCISQYWKENIVHVLVYADDDYHESRSEQDNTEPKFRVFGGLTWCMCWWLHDDNCRNEQSQYRIILTPT